MIEPIQFFVAGIPQPGGSKRGFLNKKSGRVNIVEDNKRSKDWRSVVAITAAEHIASPLSGALYVRVTFLLPRPKGHLRTGRRAGELRNSAPEFPTTKPDATKLWRSTEDALKGIAWMDDSQVVAQHIRKEYGHPGALIEIREAL